MTDDTTALDLSVFLCTLAGLMAFYVEFLGAGVWDLITATATLGILIGLYVVVTWGEY
jgi:hypothetical protein